MDMTPPPAYIAQADANQPDAPVEPTPIKIDVAKYIPDTAITVTMIVTLDTDTGSAVVYAPGDEKHGTVFKGPRSIDEVRLDGPALYIKLYGAAKFDIQYITYRMP
jgi:hypothetical protein